MNHTNLGYDWQEIVSLFAVASLLTLCIFIVIHFY